MLLVDEMTLAELQTLNGRIARLLSIYRRLDDLSFSDRFRRKITQLNVEIGLRLRDAEVFSAQVDD